MSQSSKDFILFTRNTEGVWAPHYKDAKPGEAREVEEFRTAGAAQSAGSAMLNKGLIDAFKIYKAMGLHH